MQIKVAKSYSKHLLSSKRIRETFIDYFVKENGHKFVRSSPVVPFCDPSIAFVNAGMNQFKNVFLGKLSAPAPKAANSQKCIRVGGKHNDLEVVGTDGYHHTFFEMLGNWSFGDYFKKEACTLAYNLLTGPYKIDPNRLYVTYFGGDETLGLDPDLECREIWRQIGIPMSRIIPFGKSDNFWEMGSSGPCGPCTEIHYDHLGTNDRSHLVNSGLEDLTELWNVVFIEYNRNASGTLNQLPQKLIDTGMGLERLVALLQGKDSNYDTDLFTPIFDVIHQNSKGVESYITTNSLELLKDYRVVADHSRMVTACIADKMFPDNNHKLRRILRKILLISNKTFKNDKLIHATVQQVSEILGDTYPEMKNLNTIQKVIDHEIEVYNALRKDVAKGIKNLPFNLMDLVEHDLLDYPGLVAASKDILATQSKWKRDGGKIVLPTDYAFKLYDTYGLNSEAIDRLSNLINFTWRQEDLNESLLKLRAKSKKYGQLSSHGRVLSPDLIEKIKQSFGVTQTDDSHKYEYSYNENSKTFTCPSLQAKVICVVTEHENLKIIHVVTDKTNFYYESGGQQGDVGRILTKTGSINVTNVHEENGFVIHTCSVEGSNVTINIGDIIELQVDNDRRTGNIRHHTATHLLNAVVRELFQAPTCQRSSSVQKHGLRLELSIYGPRLSKESFSEIENEIRKKIQYNALVSTETINSQKLLELDNVTTVPGDVYPDEGIRLVQIQPSISSELCCGTHCHNTKQLIDFCLLNVKFQGRASYLFTAVVGEMAVKSHQLGAQLLQRVKDLKENFSRENLPTQARNVKELVEVLSRNEVDGVPVPYLVKQEMKSSLDVLELQCRVESREALRKWVDKELKDFADKNSSSFIVHHLENSTYLEPIPLDTVDKYFPNRPILIISSSNHLVGVRSCVPKQFLTDSFTAQTWVGTVSEVFWTSPELQKTKNEKCDCTAKDRRVDPSCFEERLAVALKVSKEFASKHILR